MSRLGWRSARCAAPSIVCRSDQRAALLLVTVDGLSYKEAAEVAQVPVGTIMSRLARARIALQLQLETAGGMRRSRKDAAAQ